MVDSEIISDLSLFLIAQSIIILGAIVTAYVRTQVSIAQLEIHLQNIKERTTDIDIEHSKLRNRVDGISRAVASLTSHHNIHTE